MVNSSTKMLVLAGGFGTRLQSVVSTVPKPMAPVNGVPLLQLQLDHWIKQGQRSFIFLLHHQSEIIIDFLVHRSRYYGSVVSIEWIVEDVPLGTGGSVSNVITKKKLAGFVLIANADTWLECGLREMIGTEFPAIGVVKVKDTSRYGSVSLDHEGRIDRFEEKNLDQSAYQSGLINAGLYKLPTSTFNEVSCKSFSLEKKILPKLSESKVLRSLLIEGQFFDIGITNDYYKFCDWINLGKKNYG
jgi:D-glycero-alpha-D-manno-heptose 1-phosphate guanylyltransferase